MSKCEQSLLVRESGSAVSTGIQSQIAARSDNKKSRTSLAFACFLFPFLVSGCSLSLEKSDTPVKIDDLRREIPPRKELHLIIQRKDYQAALARGPVVNAIRMVELFSEDDPRMPREYKLFDVQDAGVYKLLGLKNGDVLVAAHGYVVRNQAQFREYVQLLINEDSSRIEVKRDGDLVLMTYDLIPHKPASK